jgi:hypothetical protein
MEAMTVEPARSLTTARATEPAPAPSPPGGHLPAGLARFHRAQEVGSSTSQVHPVSWGTDPLVGAMASPHPTPLPPTLASLAAALDAAYGYQASPSHPRGIARRAPSAGALYPIEVLAISAGRVHHYAFWDRQLRHAHACDAHAASRALGLGADDLALVTVAVFWRTVQRYGVRGYRYCMLDAANVVSNLVEVISHGDHPPALELVAPSPRLARALALPPSVGVIRAVVVRAASRLSIDAALVPAWSPPARSVALEHPPLMSPLLQRVATFHDRALDDAPSGVAMPRRASRAAAVVARRSAKAFTTAALSASHDHAICEALRRRIAILPVAHGALTSYLVRLRVAGFAPSIEAISLGSGERAEPVPAGSAAELAARVRAMCQDQGLAGEAAAVVITGIALHGLRDPGAARYRELLSEVGHVGAELGMLAAERQLGTTTIGGFSDDAARALVGDAVWCPIAIQLFGQPGRHGYKLDAASRVLENHAREEQESSWQLPT